MSGNFEAKNYMYRKNKDGIIVGLVVHPNDVDAAFAALPIGARVMIAWAAIGDDEKPMEDAWVAQAERPGPSETIGRTQGDVGETPTPRAKPKKRFEDYLLSAQCAMVCDEPAFRRFIAAYEPQNLEIANGDVVSVVRGLCGVTSRAELDKFPEAANAWRELYRHYQAYITGSKYAAVRR